MKTSRRFWNVKRLFGCSKISVLLKDCTDDFRRFDREIVGRDRFPLKNIRRTLGLKTIASQNIIDLFLELLTYSKAVMDNNEWQMKNSIWKITEL
jgi:hypothetical protein